MKLEDQIAKLMSWVDVTPKEVTNHKKRVLYRQKSDVEYANIYGKVSQSLVSIEQSNSFYMAVRKHAQKSLENLEQPQVPMNTPVAADSPVKRSLIHMFTPVSNIINNIEI